MPIRRLPAESDPKSPDAEVATETNNANSELIANFEQQQLNLKGATRPRAYARRLVYVLYTMVFLHWGLPHLEIQLLAGNRQQSSILEPTWHFFLGEYRLFMTTIIM